MDTTDNKNPFNGLSFDVGVTENKNAHYRKSMEDVHTYVANFAERLDWGYFAIFDGHAGKQTARWCGSNLHNILNDKIVGNDTMDMRENLNEAFQEADGRIKQLSVAGSSGCTAAVAVLRWEEELEEDGAEDEGTEGTDGEEDEGTDNEETEAIGDEGEINGKDETSQSIKHETQKTQTAAADATAASAQPDDNSGIFDFVPTSKHKRMLYTGNVGDSRIVLCRDGRATRLSYDHKSSDEYEQRRIVKNGGILLKGRVNGVLAVSRSLGDCYMKSLVIGAPYTTATELGAKDEFMIIACDGLWDVCTDQEAVDLIRHESDMKKASAILCNYALDQMTTDNITVMVVRLDTRIIRR